ncbi:MAG: hypothetical protein A2V77_18125 [Anaeromyxobacter sp. RBG_16_69_14]|nr:MAG: hypothetical protein A2V77_18125 [Anaeromyxobacter sp. RBG_16_69_14]
MPNFHTHWLVAYGAISRAPEPVRKGADAFLKAGSDLRTQLKLALEEPRLEAVQAAANDAMKTWKKAVEAKKDNIKDNITCFSAYMLGACGPDFWTLPSGKRNVPDTADFLFNLGHYNRTHRQFQVSVARQESREDTPKARAEQAYFCGMATHVAADLVIHQLVNVTAGAYNLLEKHWINEQRKEGMGPVARALLMAGSAGDSYPMSPSSVDAFVNSPQLSFQEEFADSGVKKFWSMHNKVEHYWDTYVRYRYLGDYGSVYPDQRDQDRAFGRLDPPLGLPTVEGLLKDIKNPPKHVREYLSHPETRRMIEKPLCFPQIYCDRATKGDDLDAKTLYEVVATRANPVSDLHPELTKERGKLEGKGEDMSGGTERSKLNYFTSKTNDYTEEPVTWNYLTYFVCPDLAKVQKCGADFYDPRALVEFVLSARGVASAFVGELTDAYASAAKPKDRKSTVDHPDKVKLGRLGNFWNLDTGLGLRVQHLGKATPEEAVTRLDFVHVLDAAGGGGQARIEVAGERPFLDGKETVQKKPENEMRTYDTILERLPAPTRSTRPSTWKVGKPLFNPGMAPCSGVDCPTEKLLSQPQLLICKPKPFLSLCLRIPTARLGAQEGELGYFLHAEPGDYRTSLYAVQQKEGEWPLRLAKEMTEAWLEKARLFDAGTNSRDHKPGKSEVKGSLQVFSTALRLSLDPADRDYWDVPKYWFGRNFAVGTGRRSVLHPVKVNGAFDPKEQLAPYDGISPTEQVFFSLYVIVKRQDGRVFEVLSGAELTRDDYQKLLRIDAAGFVKIVLHYETGAQGTLHFEECFVDGLEVPVDFALN